MTDKLAGVRALKAQCRSEFPMRKAEGRKAAIPSPITAQIRQLEPDIDVFSLAEC
jgi:hypothetical protein